MSNLLHVEHEPAAGDRVRSQIHEKSGRTARAGGILLVIASLASCDDNNGRSGTSGSNLTESDAIGAVRGYLVAQSRSTSEKKRVCHWENRQERRPCSQIDVDMDPNKGDSFLARCQPVGGTAGAPYGSKTVTVSDEVCRDDVVQTAGQCASPPEGGQWNAQYYNTSDNWRVEVVGSSRGASSWTVDDNSSAVTSHQPPC